MSPRDRRRGNGKENRHRCGGPSSSSAMQWGPCRCHLCEQTIAEAPHNLRGFQFHRRCFAAVRSHRRTCSRHGLEELANADSMMASDDPSEWRGDVLGMVGTSSQRTQARASLKRKLQEKVKKVSLVEDDLILRLQTMLSNDTFWLVVPEEDCSNCTRALYFTMLSAAGAGAQKYFGRPHARYPFRAFLRLDGRHVGAILEAVGTV